jgi:hypothetical protein
MQIIAYIYRMYSYFFTLLPFLYSVSCTVYTVRVDCALHVSGSSEYTHFLNDDKTTSSYRAISDTNNYCVAVYRRLLNDTTARVTSDVFLIAEFLEYTVFYSGVRLHTRMLQKKYSILYRFWQGEENKENDW